LVRHIRKTSVQPTEHFRRHKAQQTELAESKYSESKRYVPAPPTATAVSAGASNSALVERN
jgi:hypothetical protein